MAKKKEIINGDRDGQRRKLIDFNEPKISTTRQCQLLEINRSTLYYKVKTAVNSSENHLKDWVENLWLNRQSSGYRTIKKRLEDYDINVGYGQVRRTMNSLGIHGIAPRGSSLSMPNKAHKKYPYLLKNVKIEHKNQVWCSDITYIKTNTGKMYLTAIIDVYSRMIMGWELSNSLDASFCVNALCDAICEHGKPDIFNTDQGSQFTSDEFINVLKSHKIKISMDGKGRCLDNIFIERFWRSLKYEDIRFNDYSASNLRGGVSRYIEYYNYQRPHQGIGGEKPYELYYGADAKKELEQYISSKNYDRGEWGNLLISSGDKNIRKLAKYVA